MFKNLTNFSYTRNWKEAVGFYIAYLILCIIMAASLGALWVTMLGIDSTDAAYTEGVRAGAFIAVIYCLVIGIVVLIKKKLYKNFSFILLSAVSVLLSVFGGGLLGLIIPAVMTTKGEVVVIQDSDPQNLA